MFFYHTGGLGGGIPPDQTISVLFLREKLLLLKNDLHALKHEKKSLQLFSPIMTNFKDAFKENLKNSFMDHFK